jgi:thiosulfate reductase cytochrome b subunit
MRTVLRHPPAIRILHWINVVALLVLLTSGLQIFNAHPALYWGRQSYGGHPPLFSLMHGFPSWATLPASQWLSMGRRWHLFFAWVLVVNGTVYLAYSIASRHFQRDLRPTRGDLDAIPRSIVDHLLLRRAQGAEALRYNVLQRLAYLAVILFLLPFTILMGMGLSPGLDSLVPGWVDLFGGRQSVRTLHFAGAMGLVAFTAIHVIEVLLNDPVNELRSMITGRFGVKDDDAPREPGHE